MTFFTPEIFFFDQAVKEKVFKGIFHRDKIEKPVYKLEHLEQLVALFMYILTRLFGTKFTYMEVLHAEEKHIGYVFYLYVFNMWPEIRLRLKKNSLFASRVVLKYRFEKFSAFRDAFYPAKEVMPIPGLE